jgi:hypothetical protein
LVTLLGELTGDLQTQARRLVHHRIELPDEIRQLASIGSLP